MKELFGGTRTHEGRVICKAVIKKFAKKELTLGWILQQIDSRWMN